MNKENTILVIAAGIMSTLCLSAIIPVSEQKTALTICSVMPWVIVAVNTLFGGNSTKD